MVATKAEERKARRELWQAAIHAGCVVAYNGADGSFTTVLHTSHLSACRAVVEANDPVRVHLVIPRRRRKRAVRP